MSKLDKYIEFGTTKLKSLYKEKKFNFEGHEIKYILEEEKSSDDLIVVLSGIPREGLKARYNYMRTLEKTKINKLFILDDLGYDQRGGFYLGKDKDFYMARAVVDLIKKTKNELSTKRTIYCGSSKGGWASLYFGLQDKESIIIAGGPQYFLGHHLKHGKYITHTLPFILGKDYTEKDIENLDNLVRDVIYQTKGNGCQIHLHYSVKEYTYRNHVRYLLDDLKENKIDYQEDVADYEKHPEIAYHFPNVLIKTLRQVM